MYDQYCAAINNDEAVAPEVVEKVKEKPVEEKKEPIIVSEKTSKLMTVIRERLINIPDGMNELHLSVLIRMLVTSLEGDVNDNPFPVKLDDLAKTLEYTRSRKLAELIIENFDEKSDYIHTHRTFGCDK